MAAKWSTLEALLAAALVTALPAHAGPLETARQEAAIARHHAEAAASAADLAQAKRQVAAAVHAIDPGLVRQGPGMGQGLRPSLQRLAVEALAAMDSPSPEVRLRAGPAAVAAQTALRRTDEAIEQARQVLAADDLSAARQPLEGFGLLLSQVEAGADLDHDGEAGWASGEGGLAQAAEFVRGIEIVSGARPD